MQNSADLNKFKPYKVFDGGEMKGWRSQAYPWIMAFSILFELHGDIVCVKTMLDYMLYL